MVSTSYVPGAFWSKVFFGEEFISAKFLGLLIMIGIAFVGLGKQ
jgi:hypothetical protein